MAKGRPRTPTAKLKSQGTYQGCRRRGEPQIESGRPNPPTWLNKEARAEWNRQIDTLVDSGIMTKADRGALTSYCVAWSTFVTACRLVDKNGVTVTDLAGNKKKNPEVVVMNDAQATYMRCAQEFGLTPSARSKVQRIEKESTNDLENKYFPGTKGRTG